VTWGRCWDCKRWAKPGEIPLRMRQPDGVMAPVLTKVRLCTVHGYNNPYPVRNCYDYVSKPPGQLEPLPPEERDRWLADRGGPVTWGS
jgi:hypothetical protein